jgi:hypothetical protein
LLLAEALPGSGEERQEELADEGFSDRKGFKEVLYLNPSVFGRGLRYCQD